jgi:hypothetical protein
MSDSEKSEREEAVDGSVGRAQSVLSTRARDIATIVSRMERVEGWLASGMQPRRAAAEARKPQSDGGLGLNRTSANRYVAAALARMHSDAAIEPIESKRARMIATLHRQVERALGHKRKFETNGKVVEYDAPDLKAANQALSLLAEIEGLKRAP